MFFNVWTRPAGRARKANSGWASWSGRPWSERRGNRRRPTRKRQGRCARSMAFSRNAPTPSVGKNGSDGGRRPNSSSVRPKHDGREQNARGRSRKKPNGRGKSGRGERQKRGERKKNG